MIAAWGGAGADRARDLQVHGLLGPMKCLGLTGTGQPRHPLYARGDVELLDLAYCIRLTTGPAPTRKSPRAGEAGRRRTTAFED